MANFILITLWFLPIGSVLALLALLVAVLSFCIIVGIPLSVSCFRNSVLVE